MRNVKKFLALVLAMLMVVSAAATVSAFEDVADDHVFAAAINDLTVKEIVNGYDGETFGPDDAVTRQQMALMMARAITGNVGDDAVWAQGGLVGFEDVTEYQYAIATVVKAGIVDGFLDNTFRPEEGITFVQALKMAVCALGYDDGNLEWWNGYYNVALDLGLTENLNYITDADKALNRGEVAQLIYNMLYIDLADGSDCFASQNFGLATATNLTTFIITATDEQTAYEGMDVAEGGYVGLQTLVNGVPAGDVVYVPVEVFGFEDDEDEAAFLSAYNLVNWDEDEGTFDQIIPVGESWKIYNAEISGIKNGKFAYDGKNYYPVEALSGTAIRNEVVLYNSTDFGYDNGNKDLFLNKDGQVLDPETGVAVLEAVYAVNGNVVSYRVLINATAPDGSTVTKGDYLSVSAATAKYGAVVDNVAQSYTIIDTAKLTGAYELTVFDDDMDGKMDRAYWTPVYVSVYEGIDSNNVHQTAGPLKTGNNGSAFDDDNGKVTGLEDLAKGDLFVYTFNKQLLEVTVLEVIESQTGTIKTINTTKKNSSGNYYSTITLTDGTALTLYNDGKNDTTANAKIGANVQASQAPTYTDPDWILQMTTGDYDFELVDDDYLLAALKAGGLIRYYARNNVIIFAETYNIDDVFERVVLKDVIDADLEAVYLEVYRDGVVDEIAVTMIDGKSLADLSWIKISSLLNRFADDSANAQVYRISELENGYQISEELNYNYKKTNTTSNAAAFKLNEVKSTNTGTDSRNIVIEDNIAKAVNGYGNANRLRTNEDTIWYFIENAGTENAKVKVFSGEIERGQIEVTSKTVIFADKVGYATKNVKGIATEVYVFNAGEATTGFGWNNVDDGSIVYVAGINDDSVQDYYEMGSAEYVGLDPELYEKDTYYKYSNSYAVDMFTGDKVAVITDVELVANRFYYVDSNNVVDTSKAAINPASLAATDPIQKVSFTYAESSFETDYVTHGTLIDNDWGVEIVKATLLGKIDIKSKTVATDGTAVKDLFKVTAADGTVTYPAADIYVLKTPYTVVEGVQVDEDGVYVMIVGTATPNNTVDTTGAVTATIKNVGAADIYGKAMLTLSETDLTGTVKLYYDYGTGEELFRTDWNTAANTNCTVEFQVKEYVPKDNGDGYKYVNAGTFTGKGTIAKGVLTVSDVKLNGTFAYELPVGLYSVHVTISNVNTALANYTVEFDYIID